MPEPTTLTPPTIGVRIAGSGMAIPTGTMTNADLERVMDTSDEWIVQRTGIRERRICDREHKGESTLSLAFSALAQALENAGLAGTDLDCVLVASVTPDTPCPATASRLAQMVGTNNAPGWDINAACCSFLFALNSAHSLVRSGTFKNIGIVGVDMLSRYMKYTTKGRTTAILFGDAAGAVILNATDDTSVGPIAQAMHSDGERWGDLHIPLEYHDWPEGQDADPELHKTLIMNGRGVFKFAVSTFGDLIQETLDKAGLKPDQVDHYVCHQSNARILASARDRFGLPEDKLYVNIDRYGNTVSASVPVCYHELIEQGRVKPGQRVMFLAFGAGMTWGSSLWQL